MGQGTGLLYAPHQFPRGLLGPVSVLWQQRLKGAAAVSVLLWVHPLMFESVWLVVNKAAATTDSIG